MQSKIHMTLEFIFMEPKSSHIFSQFSEDKTPVSLKLSNDCVYALKLKLKLDKFTVSQLKLGMNFQFKIKIL